MSILKLMSSVSDSACSIHPKREASPISKREASPISNLAHNWHRTYDPVTGRYTQPDPLGFVDGPSVYAYAGNSPLVKTDRSGLQMFASPSTLPTWAIPKPAPQMCMAKPVEITVSCNVYPVTPGANCPARVSGTGIGSSSNDAFQNARRDANSKVPRGCQMRHCHPVNPSNVLPNLQ